MEPALVINGLGLENEHVGQGVYSQRIIEGLLRRSADVPFCVIAPAGSNVRTLVPSSRLVELDGRPPLRHPLVSAIYWSDRIASHAAIHHPDAVFHSPVPVWARRSPAKTVVTLHDCIYEHFPQYLGRRFVRRQFIRATERFAKRAQMILTDSEFSRRDLAVQLGVPMDRTNVLYPWVAQATFEPPSDAGSSLLRTRLALPRRFWLYVGGYDHRKNVEFLIAAYASARRGKTSCSRCSK